MGLNNADVASLLGLDVLLVANGGLGSTYDVLTLNQNLFHSRGVKVCGVILNKVRVRPKAAVFHANGSCSVVAARA